MNAVEFVKKFGLSKAKEILSTQGKTISELKREYTEEQLKEYQSYIVSGDLMSFIKLKQIVDAFELVESHGGIHGFKTYCNGDFSDADLKAINLVEQCQ